MTGARRTGGAVGWLFAQTVAFGLWAAFLGIVANALFLEAYGATWLPVTYIVIGVTGVVVSGFVSRAARSVDVTRIAITVLGGATVLQLAAWAIAVTTDTAWVSAPLLVLFPILIHLGFVFVGGQAGRLLDIAGIKANFPRIMAGFSIGAIAGGLLGPLLIALLGRTDQLLLPTALAEGAFTALVWATGRRFRAQLTGGGLHEPAAHPDTEAPAPRSRRSLRRLVGNPFVALVATYVVLSALASQLAEYVVMDRAVARYPAAEDLAVFMSAYTAALNIVILAFLFLLAGPLMRRFGLRLGITANPLVVTALALAMILVFLATGATSFALLAVASATRILDLSLNNGTTRTSLNAMYLVLPERARLSAQAAVEGAGYPLAIGISGVLIIVLNTLPFALPATLVTTAGVAAVWTVIAVRLYRAYRPALAEALRVRPLLDELAADTALAREASSVQRLLESADPRTARLGLDLAVGASAPWLPVELQGQVDDERPEVRLAALAALARGGDAAVSDRLADEVHAGLASPDPAVRRAALNAVQPGDAAAVTVAVAALADPATMGAAAGAIVRLGDAVLPVLDERLAEPGPVAGSGLVRLVCAAGAGSTVRGAVLARHVQHPDRELGLAILERVAAPDPAEGPLATALRAVADEELQHAGRILRALEGITPSDGERRPASEPLERGLNDELDLVRRRLAAALLARLGTKRLGSALLGLEASGERHGLAIEALEVELGAVEARRIRAVLESGLAPADRLAVLVAEGVVAGRAEHDAVIRDLVEDASGVWRSAWLRACAIHAAAAGILDTLDLTTARALGDPVVDEELAVRAA